ncbi:RNA ligase [Brevibacterium phage Cantare]|uniref:RNA ligase n=1 Tax=Brevibacterium phage Cantare TaxID=2338395 RepID=A0A3G3LYM2_9CAUD|nr:RNA ligase [Brevibacterium phage Cantare]AYQ99230.1 RNA ligase [Brevibacterium phage Cantare]
MLEPIQELLDALRQSLTGYINEPVKKQTFSSIFVGLYPTYEDAQKIVKTFNLHPSWADDLHVTMVYANPDDNPDEAQINDIFRVLIGQLPTLITAKLNGVTRFAGNDEDGDALVLNVDHPSIEQARRILTSDQRLVINDQHGFTPHMTIAYLNRDTPTPIDRVPEVLQVEFDRISVGYQSAYTHYSLGHNDIKELTIDDVNIYLPATIDDESGERAELNPKRRRSYNMEHVKEG